MRVVPLIKQMKDGIEHIWLCRFEGSPVWDLLYKERNGRPDLGNLALEITSPYFPSSTLTVPLDEAAKYWPHGSIKGGNGRLNLYVVPLLNLHGIPPIECPGVTWQLFERKAIKGDEFGWEVQHVL